MDLKTFVSSALTQIAEGIKEAQEANTGALIAPLLHYSGDNPNKKLTVTENTSHNHAQSIVFDVAVTTIEDSKSKGGIALKIIVASFGGETETAQQNATVSRIRFEIPVIWPAQKP